MPLPSPRPAARSKAGPITSNGQILALKSPLHASILLPNLYHLCPLPWKVSLFLPALKFLKFHAGNLHCLVAKLNVSNDLINGTPLQYSCLENPMDRGAWWAAVHGVARSWTRLSDFTLTFHFHALEEEMATHSSVLAWGIPGTGKPGGLPSMRSHSQTEVT